MDDGRSMRAVKDGLPTPSGESEESEGPRWIRAVRLTVKSVADPECYLHQRQS